MNKSVIEKFLENYRRSIIDSGVISNIVKQSQSIMKNVTKIIQPFLDQIKEESKKVAKASIDLGFYPSDNFNLFEIEFLDLNDEKKQVKYICNKIRKLVTFEYMNEMADFFQKTKINNIYKDYSNKHFEDAILKTIVIINVIINDHFDAVSGEQIYDIGRNFNNKVTGLNLPNKYMQQKQNSTDWESVKKFHKEDGFEEYAYYIFYPYCIKKDDNPLYKSFDYKTESPKNVKTKYKRIPYNRNAILHGYVENYGTEENCLRWFSVLINTYELFKLLEELKVNE